MLLLFLAFLEASSYFQRNIATQRKREEGADRLDVRVHIVVEGLVQGVGFRWFVARAAEELGLIGYARNLSDGSVEIEAEGKRSLIEELIGKVKVGPRSAQVRDLKIDWMNPAQLPQSSKNFEIR